MSKAVIIDGIAYNEYQSELQLPEIIRLIENDLSEPYSVYTYRYFIHNWPNLCFLALDGDEHVGVVICKLDRHKDRLRGYIAMLAVAKTHRKKSIGSNLVKMAIHAMKEMNADEVVLETEYTNSGALRLYERLGFIRDKRLYRYYLNGVDAFRLKLFCKTMVKTRLI
ncbi:putative acyltransfersase [Mycotypha africana]|uniref:putative acyltransfersase n=1 Tax=Mycotypha africana TaxID=64632 RepID=UPI002301BF9B|nr:putative acyltransfersase [Mycotypha africana]KAI8973240.1 putative acyltransfersase [Mycotypha africana]